MCSGVAFLPDGYRGVFSNSFALHIIDLSTGWKLQILHAKKINQAETATSSGPVLSQDGNIAITGESNGEIELWDMKNSRLAYVANAHQFDIISVDISSDGKLGMSLGSLPGSTERYNNTAIRLWDIGFGLNLKKEFSVIPYAAKAIFSPDGKWVICGNDAGQLYVWRTSDGILSEAVSAHSGWIRALAFSPNGEFVLSSGQDERFFAFGNLVETLVINVNSG